MIVGFNIRAKVSKTMSGEKKGRSELIGKWDELGYLRVWPDRRYRRPDTENRWSGLIRHINFTCGMLHLLYEKTFFSHRAVYLFSYRFCAAGYYSADRSRQKEQYGTAAKALCHFDISRWFPLWLCAKAWGPQPACAERRGNKGGRYDSFLSFPDFSQSLQHRHWSLSISSWVSE